MELPGQRERRCDRDRVEAAALPERLSLDMAATEEPPVAVAVEEVQHFPLDQIAAAMAGPVPVARFG
jgi:hypothetical protein